MPTPVTKGTSGITVLSERDVERSEETACVRCGRCVQVCPMQLVPTKLALATRAGSREVLVCILGLTLAESRRRALTFVGVAGGLGALLIAALEPLRTLWSHALWRAEIALTMTGNSESASQSVVERVRFIEKGLDLLAESPITGRGLDTFRWLSGEGTYAHNNIVELGVALGLIGIILFYGLHVSILTGAARSRRKGSFVWRFVTIAVPTLLLLDVAVVSYASKLSTILLIMSAGWLERTLAQDVPPSS